MRALNLLYLGLASGTSLDRANAYRRLGHSVTHIDLRQLLPTTVWIDRITWHLGDNWLSPLLKFQLAKKLVGLSFDYCHVDSGEWVDASVVRVLKQHCAQVINYNIDDPTGPRDTKRFNCYRKSLAEYDLVVVVRQENVQEVKNLGAKSVFRVFRSADETSHSPRLLTTQDHQKWDCEVLFLGTWMPERGPFLLSLVKSGVPLTIRGARWEKAPEWKDLHPFWKGGHIEGDDYAKAIQCAKVNIGLLSKGNRDLHTTRSLEIPALGGLLCAERTAEHLGMYKENSEALFWSSAAECAEKCISAINNPTQSSKIAKNGSNRIKTNQHYNECVLLSILEQVQHDK